MAALTTTVLTDEEGDLLRRFTVNKNYLAALSGFLSWQYGRHGALYTGLAASVGAHAPYQKIKRGQADLDEVRRYLTLGWASEIQLRLPTAMGNNAIVGFANAWAPVHAYYSAFGLLQAWFAANQMGGTANDHAATLRTISRMIQQRDLFPEPWNLLAVGCPMRGERLHLNARGVDCTARVEVLALPSPFGLDPTFWARFGTWLRSTREARLLARENAWKAENKKGRIAPAERTRIALALAPTSLFDCLWRMRVKSNYGTIDPYLLAQITPGDHLVFNRALSAVTSATVGLLELYTRRRIGKKAYQDIAAEFVRQDSAGLSAETVQARCKAFGIAL